MNKSLLRYLLSSLGIAVPAAVGPTAVAAGRALTQADHGATLVYTGAGAGTFTIPKGLASGFKFTLIQGAAGVATIAGASGVTVAGVVGVKTAGANAVVEVRNSAADKYAVTGGASA